MSAIRIDTALIDKLGQPDTVSGGEEYRFCCPFCESMGKSPDVSGHLYFNPAQHDGSGAWVCHRCGSKGNTRSMYLRLGIPISDRTGQTLVTDFFKFMDDALRSLDEDPDVEVDAKCGTIPLPPGCKVTVYHTAYNYLTSRGLTYDDIQYYNIMVGFGKYQDRVIIPDGVVGGEAIYWVARLVPGNMKISPTFYDHKRNKFVERPKYLNPKTPRQNKVFDLERVAKSYRHTVICEGVFSSILAGRDSTATYGKLATDIQVRMLRDAGFELYYVGYDGDALAEAAGLADKLLFYGVPEVRVVRIPHEHDPASLGRDPYRQYVLQANRYDQLEFMLSMLE